MRKEVGAHLRRPLTSLRSAKRMEWVRKSPFPIELLSLRIQNLTRRQVVCPAASKADRLTGWSAARIELLFLILTPANKNPPRLSSNQVNNTFQFAALETNTQRKRGQPFASEKRAARRGRTRKGVSIVVAVCVSHLPCKFIYATTTTMPAASNYLSARGSLE